MPEEWSPPIVAVNETQRITITATYGPDSKFKECDGYNLTWLWRIKSVDGGSGSDGMQEGEPKPDWINLINATTQSPTIVAAFPSAGRWNVTLEVDSIWESDECGIGGGAPRPVTTPDAIAATLQITSTGQPQVTQDPALKSTSLTASTVPDGLTVKWSATDHGMPYYSFTESGSGDETPSETITGTTATFSLNNQLEGFDLWGVDRAVAVTATLEKAPQVADSVNVETIKFTRADANGTTYRNRGNLEVRVPLFEPAGEESRIHAGLKGGQSLNAQVQSESDYVAPDTQSDDAANEAEFEIKYQSRLDRGDGTYFLTGLFEFWGLYWAVGTTSQRVLATTVPDGAIQKEIGGYEIVSTGGAAVGNINKKTTPSAASSSFAGNNPQYGVELGLKGGGLTVTGTFQKQPQPRNFSEKINLGEAKAKIPWSKNDGQHTANLLILNIVQLQVAAGVEIETFIKADWDLRAKSRVDYHDSTLDSIVFVPLY